MTKLKRQYKDEDKWIGLYTKHTELDSKAMVGHSSKEDLNLTAKDIVNKLKINEDEIVLDFACGNGEITKLIGKHCKFILGIDHSKYLIEYANKNNSGTNIGYLLADNKNFVQMIKKEYPNLVFSKLFSNEGASQYLEFITFISFIKETQKILTEDSLILLSGTLLKTNKFKYYRCNTLKQKIVFYIANYVANLKKHFFPTKPDLMGYWYDVGKVFAVFTDMDYDVAITNNLSHRSYRFDFLLKKRRSND